MDVWHKDVRFFNITRNGEVIGRFYLDLYARANKRGGAWMDVCRSRWLKEDSLQLPVAYLTCNFTPPVGDKPALLTHDEVVTLFHEFGHGLHHMLTQVNYLAVSGISGVAWDAVELPSQFMENWCWEKEGLELISSHYETGEPLPVDMLDKPCSKKLSISNDDDASASFHCLILFYKDYQPNISVQQILDDVRSLVAVVMPLSLIVFKTVSAIFLQGVMQRDITVINGQVLSADAFSRFEEEGIFNPETGASFLREVLEKGEQKSRWCCSVTSVVVSRLLKHC